MSDDEPAALRLRPCPFCGRPAEHKPYAGGRLDRVMVSCSWGDCEPRPDVTGATLQEAAARWNARTPDVAQLLEILIPGLEAHVALLAVGGRQREAAIPLAVARAALDAVRGSPLTHPET